MSNVQAYIIAIPEGAYYGSGHELIGPFPNRTAAEEWSRRSESRFWAWLHDRSTGEGEDYRTPDHDIISPLNATSPEQFTDQQLAHEEARRWRAEYEAMKAAESGSDA